MKSAERSPARGLRAVWIKRTFLVFCILAIFPLAMPAESAQRVEIFVTAWCPYCRALESFLEKMKVRYQRYDIESSREGMRRYEQLGGGGVPITVIDGKVIRGFDAEELKSALNKQGAPSEPQEI